MGVFIRDRCSAEPSEETEFGPPPTDVQTAMTVLGRRPARSEPNLVDLTRTKLAGVVLPHVQRLHGANLSGAQLDNAYLEGAQLPGTFLDQTQMRGAHLVAADLSGSNLISAQLSGANLEGADLRHAFLRDADLTHALLSGAQLHGAILDGARLQGASGLTTDQLRTAVTATTTELDPELQGALHKGQ